MSATSKGFLFFIRGRCNGFMLLAMFVACLVTTGCKSDSAADKERPNGSMAPIRDGATAPIRDSSQTSDSRSDGDIYDLKMHPGATIIHPVDPHTLTASQVKFGVAPKRDPSVEYQPDIILMENGDKAIKSVATDGMTWTFDANAPQVSDFQEGKIVFATGRAVGRVLSLKRQGDSVNVILGPIQLTDVIRNGSFAMNETVDLNNMLSYVAPDFPEPPERSPTAAAAPKTSSLHRAVPDHLDERMVISRVSMSGKWTPASMIKRFADGRELSYQRVGHAWVPAITRTGVRTPQLPAQPPSKPRLLAADWQGFQMPGNPGVGGIQALKIPEQVLPPPPTLGPVPTVDLQGVNATALAGGKGIGVQYSYNKNGLRVVASGYASLRDSGVAFFLHIDKNGIQDCGVSLKGAVGIKLHLNSSASRDFNVNFHKTIWLPIDLTIPLGGAVPLSMTFNSSFSIDTAFSAKTSVLNAEGEYSFGGGVNAGYWAHKWRVTTPTDLKAVSDLGNTVEGISVGINSLVMGFNVRTLIGMGSFGFNCGVYAGLRFAGTVTRAPNIGFPCRQGTIDAFIDSGVGYAIPGWLTDAVNFFLSPFTSHKIERNGTLLRGPTYGLFHGNTQFPANCATPKGG